MTAYSAVVVFIPEPISVILPETVTGTIWAARVMTAWSKTGRGTQLTGIGEGVFKNASRYNMGGSGNEVGDFNSDGRPDLVWIDSGTGSVTLWLNVVTGFRHATDTTITSTASPAAFGKPLTLSAVVTPAFPGAVTGSVTFSDAGPALATVPLVGSKATFT